MEEGRRKERITMVARGRRYFSSHPYSHPHSTLNLHSGISHLLFTSLSRLKVHRACLWLGRSGSLPIFLVLVQVKLVVQRDPFNALTFKATTIVRTDSCCSLRKIGSERDPSPTSLIPAITRRARSLNKVFNNLSPWRVCLSCLQNLLSIRVSARQGGL
jgi:hypothetical protein